MKLSTKFTILEELKKANDIVKDLYAFPDVQGGSSNKCCGDALNINKHIGRVIKLINSEPCSKL